MDRALAAEWCEMLLSNPDIKCTSTLEQFDYTKEAQVCGYCSLGILSYITDWYNADGEIVYPDVPISGREPPPLKTLRVVDPFRCHYPAYKDDYLYHLNDDYKYSFEKMVEVIMYNVDAL